MARLHTHKRGKSQSTRPIGKRLPDWSKREREEVESLVIDLAKEGYSPSVIGIILRDQYGIPLTKAIVGKKIARVLKDANVTTEMPEDLQNLVKKAVSLSRHLKRHKRDKVNIRSLQLIESKIHRLSEYYKKKGSIPKTWKYKFEMAKLV